MASYESKQITLGVLLLAMGVGATGCVVWPQKEDFGDSVRHMQSAQTATSATQVAPQDGERTRAVLQTYRQDISKPQEIKNEITINVGEGN